MDEKEPHKQAAIDQRRTPQGGSNNAHQDHRFLRRNRQRGRRDRARPLVRPRRRRCLARPTCATPRGRPPAREPPRKRPQELLGARRQLLGDPEASAATSSPTARPPRACAALAERRGRRRRSCSARTHTPPRATSRSATPPSACSRAAPRRRDRSRRPRRGATAPVSRSSPSATANGGARGDRPGDRRRSRRDCRAGRRRDADLRRDRLAPAKQRPVRSRSALGRAPDRDRHAARCWSCRAG